MVKMKTGALYLVTGGDYLLGQRVRLTNNDGSEMPGFKSEESGISRFIYIKNVVRIKNKKHKIVGRKYIMNTSDHSTFRIGDVLELILDDGDDEPRFKRLSDGEVCWVGMHKVELLRDEKAKKDKTINIGDTVVGKKSATIHYGITQEGYEGVVVHKGTFRFGTEFITIKSDEGTFRVEAEHFKKIKPVKEENKDTKINVGSTVRLVKTDETERRYHYISGSMIPVGTVIKIETIRMNDEDKGKIMHDGYNYALEDFELVTDTELSKQETEKALEEEYARLSVDKKKFRVIEGSDNYYHNFEVDDVVTLTGEKSHSGTKEFKLFGSDRTQFLQDHMVELLK